jgi:hypothetical protein
MPARRSAAIVSTAAGEIACMRAGVHATDARFVCAPPVCAATAEPHAATPSRGSSYR